MSAEWRHVQKFDSCDVDSQLWPCDAERMRVERDAADEQIAQDREVIYLLRDERDAAIRRAEEAGGRLERLIDAVTLYRDAKPNTRQVPDGLNAIIESAIALVDSRLPSADEVRGILE